MSFTLKSLAIAAIIMVTMAATGCKKEDYSERTGFVIWSGEFIDGGCGWLLSFPVDMQYQPWNLPDDFKVDSLPVHVTYKDLKKRPDCLNLPDVDGQIYVHKIERVL
ncbi:hypothetical protein BH09BAC1_BH09BAC1_01000 [soil metagenome]